MTTLTSFGAFHEPSQPEDPPENVFSKLFHRVKNTLSNSHGPGGGGGGGGGLAHLSTPPPPFSSLDSGQLAAADIIPNGGGSGGGDYLPPSLFVSSSNNKASDSYDVRSDIGTVSSSTLNLGSDLGSDLGSWIITPDTNNINNGTNRRSLPEDKERISIPARRLYPNANASRRPSSLFKVSTIDHSIIQDDDSASGSLSSLLAPPVVSFGPAFGGSPQNESVVGTTTATTAVRTVDHTRLSTADSSAARDYINTLRAKEALADSDTRSIRSFSSGHHKGNSLTKLIRRVRGEGVVSKEYWMTDENAKECFGCNAPFSMMRRKHHCRICGVIFCSKCASNIISGAELGYEGDLRVCKYCLQQYEQESDDYISGTAWPATAPAPSNGHGYSLQPTSSSALNSAAADATPLDGIRKFLHAGSNLFLARSRSNTTTGDPQIDGGNAVPFRRPIAFEGGGDINDSILDPELVPYMGEDDDDDQDDLWPTNTTSNSMGPLGSFNSPYREVGSSSYDDDPLEYNSPKEKPMLRMAKQDSFNRRISINGGRPNHRNLSLNLKTRGGLMRSDGSESMRSPLDMRPASPFLVPNSQAALLNRHSRAASMVASKVEINSSSLQHMRRLLCQLLARSNIVNGDEWEEVIMKVVINVSNSIQVIRAMDVMEVVKIKKIPGGTPQDTVYINGVVCTKNLAHKQMSRTLHHPKILILRFALEYQRLENHFMSLEPIVSQEMKYLEHLVTRIVALNPGIIVVEKTVSRLALELLLKYNVAIAYNVKPEVIEAISRSTGADAIKSMDQLVKEPRLGTCGLFEIKTFVHELIPNKRKSYMFFQHCPGHHFCSLVLRGGSQNILERIKGIVELMVWVSYNLKMETALINDQSAITYPLSEARIIEEETVEISSDPDISRLQELLIPYKQTILSASPFVRFNPPFLLTQMIGNAEKLKAIERTTTPTALRDIGNSKIMSMTTSTNAIINKSSTGRSQDSGFVEGVYIDISNDFQAKSKAWEDFLRFGVGPSHMVPSSYRGLTFLFSKVCMTTKTTCAGPDIYPIEYYHSGSDVTLANYLGQLCVDQNYPCSFQACGRLLLDHQHIYAHGDAKVTITVGQWNPPKTFKQDSIMMWSRCKVCQYETAHEYMSDDTRNYSFGKFLELIFHQSNLTCRSRVCPHDINHNHIRFFGLNTRLVKVERIPIRLFDINLPPMLVRCKPEFYVRSKNQDLDLVRSLIIRYWDSVMERVKNCIFNVVQPSKIEAAKQELQEMSRNVVVEKKGSLQLLQQAYHNSSPTDNLSLNMVRIKLNEKAAEWDKTFRTFAREYFNPDRDFRRSTTAQFGRIFDENEFPVASDRAHHVNLVNDLPVTLDSSSDINGDQNDDPQDHPIPTELPYLGSSPTLKATNPRIEEADVAALESAIASASSQIAFPFIEPKVTRRLSMNLMQELRPKLTQALTTESIVTLTVDDLSEKSRPKALTPPPPSISRITSPPLSRSAARVSSRLSMVTLPTFDPMSLLQPEWKETQSHQHHHHHHQAKSGGGHILASSSSTSIPSSTGGTTSSPLLSSNKNLSDRIIIPLNRTPSAERPSSTGSTSSARSQYFFSKSSSRPRRPTENTTTISSSTSSASSPPSGHPFSNNGPAPLTSLGSKRSHYLTQAQTGGGSGASVHTQASSGSTGSFGLSSEGQQKSITGNRNRSMTQPMPVLQKGIHRTRYMNALSNRNPRPQETKQPTIEVFSSVKEAAKEESDDEDDNQSEGEGDEPYQPSRGYTFSLIQTDAMDEALGSEDPLSMEAASRSHSGGGGGGSGWNNNGDDNSFLDPVMMMFLGEDDYSPDQQSIATTTKANNGSLPPPKSSMNITVSGTLSAALAAASKLPQLSEVAEGVERGSLIKTLSNLWHDRHSRNFTPLNYPFSIIALTLSSTEYVKRLKGIFKGDGGADLGGSGSGSNSNSNQHTTTTTSAPMSNSGTATPAEESSSSTTVSSSFDGSGGGNNNTPLLSSSTMSSMVEGIYDDIPVLDDSLLSEPGTHMKFQFVDGPTMLYCKIFYMEQFHALRKAAGCEYSYIQSLARCMRWDATGGKSGSSFLKTKDDRFIMKQLSKVELEAFIKFAPHYFQYMHKAIYDKQPTVLAKIFGFYRVGYKYGALSRSMNMDVLVMENLFYDRKNLQIFDLKGSRRNRFVQPTGKEMEVLLDENFIEFMSKSPFFIRQHAQLQLLESLRNDSFFLQQFNIMDYSLLVAVADDRREILVGIVDFIRPFTWDKKLESWVKDAVGSREPTIVSPSQYRKRFKNAMKRHLDMVPDRWFKNFSREQQHHHPGVKHKTTTSTATDAHEQSSSSQSQQQQQQQQHSIQESTTGGGEHDRELSGQEQRKGHLQLHQHYSTTSSTSRTERASSHSNLHYHSRNNTNDERGSIGGQSSRPTSSLIN
ncbi:1-phosphatidylinositol-3-phosphate 5-kinase [Modicella reniformis]|uniref:1-phosphatidylinositol-3-phosphate 5-kinase n=1 Tax=Modicella reniformis TaxID=1440133 RepID=A0A9P6INF3_9FUNG|nr:1-phosphatidylinositol-3-phosphate 5-kinase [Modicella reniformis]